MVWSPAYEMPLGEHVYPSEKYRLVLERLLERGVVDRDHVRRPDPASYRVLGRVHTESYLEKLREGKFTQVEIWRMEVPFSPEIRRAFRLACGGTTLAARLAMERGVAVHLGGGFHHAFPDHAEGFCLLNDVAVCLRALRSRGDAREAAVVDCDVHHGNGTAAIFQGEGWAYTLSLHQQNLYPARKPRGDLDVALPDLTGDRRYLEALEEALETLFREHAPEVVLYLSGADPYRDDQLGGLALTRDGLERRDELVLRRCRRERVPVAVLLAGGYARRLADTIEIHARTIRAARRALAPVA